MAKVSEVFASGETLKAADLQDQAVLLTIAGARAKEFDDGNKIVIEFDGTSKVLICNKTNASMIAHYYGDDTDGWVGHQIELYPTIVDFRGTPTPAIRVRKHVPAAAPTQALPQAQPQDGQPWDRGGDEPPPIDDSRPF